jgi:hypothetical protein
MTPGVPQAVRLVALAPNVKAPKPPFGLSGWSADADALAVVLDATDDDMEDAAAVARQLPDPGALRPRTPVFVFGSAARRTGWPRRWFGPSHVPVDRATRCAALLARGYVGIGALVDRETRADIVYAMSPDEREDA